MVILRVVSLLMMLLTLMNCSQEQGLTAGASTELNTGSADMQAAILHSASQQDIDQLAQNLVVKYHHIDNTPSAHCDQNTENGNCFLVALELTAPQAIAAKDWQIFFSQITPIQKSISDEFTITHINGDLHKISLTEHYRGFADNETKVIEFYANFWSLSETDALPNYIVASVNASVNTSISSAITPKVIASTQVIIDAETGLETLPYVVPYTDEVKQFKRTKTDNTQWLTAERLYERNAQQTFTELDDLLQQVAHAIIPTPSEASFNVDGKTLDLSQGINIAFNNVLPGDVNAGIDRLIKLGIKLSKNSAVTLDLQLIAAAKPNSQVSGAYQLTIDENSIAIKAEETAGIFYGLQSIASLYQVGSNTLPLAMIKDQPHFEFRGLLLDVARNFRDKAFVLSLLEQMSAYKLNKLHLHLGDDEGWRLAIPSLPELTDIGGQRCFDLQEKSCLMPQLGAGLDPTSAVNGYYTVADYQEILQAASARHIQVIPSLDMPGHSRAAVKAMNARYHKYLVQENLEKAQQFLLEDFQDTTQYSSVQYYNDNTINVCLESSFAFVAEVMQQVKAIHQQAGQPLTRYHIGADETAGAWVESPACKDFFANNPYGVSKASELGGYFVERVSRLLAEMDIETAAWSDGLSHTRRDKMPAVVQANAWSLLMWNGHTAAHELANRNWHVVVSTPDVLYFDFPYEADPKEHGYYWASRHINSEKIFQFMPDNLPVHAEFWLDREENPYVADDTLKVDESGKIISQPLEKGRLFAGVQGQLWSENTRTDNTAQYKLFPRLLALAERSWYKPNWAVDYDHQGFVYSQKTQRFSADKKVARDNQWQLFSATVGLKEFDKLALDNIHFRLPTVGAKIKAGQLQANVAYPGLAIYYRELSKNPAGKSAAKWQLYRQPVAVQGDIEVRSQHLASGRVGRSLIVTNISQ
ncbi:MAG: family 20 glycosylhydrolase [Thalassotalea sp.]